MALILALLILGPTSDLPLLEADPPKHWRALQVEGEKNSQTPLQKWEIGSGEERLEIELYNFPFFSLDQSIPPEIHLARWLDKLDHPDPLTYSVIPTSHGGYRGLLLDHEEALYASFQLSPPLAKQLLKAFHREKTPYHRDRLSDFTLKVIGSKALLDQERANILSFVDSIELVDEIPFNDP